MTRLRIALISMLPVLIATAFGQGGKVAPKPLFRDPVFDGAADPAVVWDRSEKKWIMFYTNRRASATDLPGVSWVHGTKIGMVESRDGGATWKYTGTADITYGKADTTYWAPEIFYREGVHHMFLSIVPGIFNDWNAGREIIHLTSKGLHKWHYEATLDLKSDRVIDACVIELPSGGFRMWYKNERAKDGSLYYADSPDLYQWTSHGNAIPGVAGEGPKVFRWQDRYWMIVDVWNGIAVFNSTDCLKWTRQSDNILKEPGTIATDQSKGGHADVIVSRGRAYLFYFVHQGGKDAEGKDPEWKRRSVIQVVELKVKGGVLVCDRNQPTEIALAPL